MKSEKLKSIKKIYIYISDQRSKNDQRKRCVEWRQEVTVILMHVV